MGSTLTNFSAKVVIGDRDLTGAQQVVATIKQNGGSAVCIALDVRNWDDQVNMFELAMKEYGRVDIVVSSSRPIYLFLINLIGPQRRSRRNGSVQDSKNRKVRRQTSQAVIHDH